MPRIGPDDSATIYSTGKIKIGNDGNRWIVTKTSAGIKRWSRYHASKKTKKESRKISKRKSNEFASNHSDKYIIKLKFYFVRTFGTKKYDPGDEITQQEIALIKKEKNPSISEITKYLSNGNRYKTFLKYTINKYGHIRDEKISNGIVSFSFAPINKRLTKQDIFNLLYRFNLIDTFYTGAVPGSELIYPSSTNGSYELGLLDYRKKSGIIITSDN